MSSENPSRFQQNLLPALMLVAIGLACAVILSTNDPHVDLWSHFQFGQDLRQGGVESQGWVNPDHLSQATLSLLVENFGSASLVLAKCLMGLAVIGMIVWNCHRMGVGLLTICGVSLLVAINLTRQWSVSPKIVSYFLFAMMLFLLQAIFQRWSDRWRLTLSWRRDKQILIPYDPDQMRQLWLLPVLFLVWCNSHGGFLIGLGVLCIYLFCRAGEALTSQGNVGRPQVVRFALVGLTCLVVTLLNPFGIQLHQQLISWGTRPWPEFTEWHSPDLGLVQYAPLTLLILSWLFALAFTRQSRDFTGLLLTTATAIAALESQYYVPFFAISFGFFIPVHFESVCRFFRISTVSTLEVSKPLHRWLFVTVAGLLIVLLSIRLTVRDWGIQVNRGEYPVSAVRFIKRHNLTGKMICYFDWSPYVIGNCSRNERGEPAIHVAFDRRFRLRYSQEAIDRYFDLFEGALSCTRYRSPDSPTYDPTQVLKVERPDLVLLNRRQPQAVGTLRKNKSCWTLLYQDDIAQLWGRTSRFGDPSSAFYVAPKQRAISESPQLGLASWKSS